MIRLSRLNGNRFILNCELIKYIEATPDTLITLASGATAGSDEKLMVRESVDEVIRLTSEYRQSLRGELPANPAAAVKG